MNKTSFKSIFKKASITYFYASRFFPKSVRADVELLYAFVRTVDDFVDQIPPQKKEFYQFKPDFLSALKGKKSKSKLIMEFVELQHTQRFNPEWVFSFLNAMESDLKISEYKTLEETLEYMYGSAEVIGLMMARVLNLPVQAEATAALLGRAMQYANFIRDIEEDVRLGRCYFPCEVFEPLGTKTLDRSVNPAIFRKLIRQEINRYKLWQLQAEDGYQYLPRRYKIAIKTAAEMYKWTISRIEKDPMIVWEKKIKPSKWMVVATGLKIALIG